MKNNVYNVLLSGVGGQGILLASRVLAETALAAGFEVKKAEVHGMAQRGGSVVSHIRYGDVVFSPLIPKGEADFLVSFEALETLRYLDFLHERSTIIFNEQKILPQSVRTGETAYPENIPQRCKPYAVQVLSVNAVESAESIGDRRVTNILLLGMLSTYLLLGNNLWLEAIEKHVPAKSFELNQKAFLYGQLLAQKQTQQLIATR